MVIGEVLNQRMMIAQNKIIDIISDSDREGYLKKQETRLRTRFANTSFGGEFPIVPVSACPRKGEEILPPINIELP